MDSKGGYNYEQLHGNSKEYYRNDKELYPNYFIEDYLLVPKFYITQPENQNNDH